jgi:hypothetical protein
MGPAADMRTFFRAVWKEMKRSFDFNEEQHNSDQMYFANVFAEQEYIRKRLRSEEAGEPMQIEKGNKVPNVDDDHETEFHVGLDYESRVFQTCAGYEGFIHWTTFDKPPPYAGVQTTRSAKIALEDDILLSPKPFVALSQESGDDQLSAVPWTGISLGVNTATGFAFPVLHFTGEKSLCDLWWPRMWFYPYAKRLLRASARSDEDVIGGGEINGTRWKKATPPKIEGSGAVKSGDAWSDGGARLSWNELCAEHEEKLYSS